jgi:hypothetical protein
LKEAGKVINSKDALDNLKKERDNDKKPLPGAIMDIFQELLNQKDDTLRSFLDAGAGEILRDIKRMEDYRRALEVTKFKGEKQLIGKQTPTNKLLLELLSTGRVEEFNYVCHKHDIYPDLSNADLSNGKLSEANLSEANLLNAKLSYADLSYGKLSGANLSYADLSNAKLSFAILSNAKLSKAILLGTYLTHSDLTHVDLSFTNLLNANLLNANLLNANLLNANLSGAKLHSSIIIGARYQDNDLKCVDADFNDDAIIDDENLSIQLSKGGAINVPTAVKNKKDLRKELEERGLPANKFLYRSSLSK